MHSDEPARRMPGSLQDAVMAVLWRSGRQLTAGDVRCALPGGTELAYTTVVTILSRLYAKGMLARERGAGRAYAYRPVADPAGLTARRMHEVLTGGDDRGAVLARFVLDLSPDDERILRQLLDTGGTA